MEMFNNQERSGYEEIVSYGPKFYTNIKEMDAIYRFAGWTLDIMAADLEKLINTQFVENMSGEQILNLEKFLDIKQTQDLSLEERKQNLITIIYSNKKTNERNLKSDLERIIGKDAQVTIKMDDVLIVEVESIDKSDYTYRQINDYLTSNLPAHLSFSVIYNKLIQAVNYNGVIWQDDELFILRQVN